MPDKHSDRHQEAYRTRRTEHRGFVRYQRSDYLLTGRVLAARRDGSMLLWTVSGLQKVRLLQPASEKTSESILARLRTLLLRRVCVRVIGRDAQQGLLVQDRLERGCLDQGRQGQQDQITSAQREVPPLCPDCGRTMVLRQAHSGAARGLLIWGCPGYPLCQAVKHLA